MTTSYLNLKEEDRKRLLDAPALITILVGGADDDLSEAERNKAAKTIKIRTYDEESELKAYYDLVRYDFKARVRSLLGELPQHTDTRTQAIADRLAKLNAVFAQMDQKLAFQFYDDFIKLATAVARTEGGFLRWITIGPKEAKVVELPMIDAIEEPEAEE
ncbi:MAG: hypothetical protein AAFR97_03325 [Bacteroidota bacterium]